MPVRRSDRRARLGSLRAYPRGPVAAVRAAVLLLFLGVLASACSSPLVKPAKTIRPPKRTLSEAGRQRIIAAQKARWAKFKKAAGGKGRKPAKAAARPAGEAKPA